MVALALEGDYRVCERRGRQAEGIVERSRVVAVPGEAKVGRHRNFPTCTSGESNSV